MKIKLRCTKSYFAADKQYYPGDEIELVADSIYAIDGYTYSLGSFELVEDKPVQTTPKNQMCFNDFFGGQQFERIEFK